ncbi:MAG TPA: phosphatase PAP2 family protein [Solirubrobacterales bacterium]|nr:phosphatase PAP2 family protein [Solirubrobacterales bacterium]
MPVLALGWAILIGGAALVAVLAIVVSQTDLLHGLDYAAAQWSHDHVTASTRRALTYVTDLGETRTVAIVAVLVTLVDLNRRRNPWTPFFLLLVILGDKLLTQELKGLVDRTRPAFEPLAATLGPSFPSGHSSTAAASWAAFAFVAGLWWGRRAWPFLAGLAVAIAVAVAAGRVLLDVHWSTDVVGGLALGWAWFAACALALGRRLVRPDGRAGTGTLGIRQSAVSGSTRKAAEPN